MPRDPVVYLDDILEAIGKIRQFLGDQTFEQFRSDEKTADAVVRNLEVIGEAVKQVPDELKHQAPAVDWKRIAGLRDVLIHAYFAVDKEIVWDVIRNKLPALETEIRKMVSRID
jgi:uncharacterized protein with HEPN domain